MGRVKEQLLLAGSKTSPLRRWMERRRMLPLSPLGRFFWRTLAITIVIGLLTRLTGSHGWIGQIVTVLSVLADLVTITVGLYLLTRWLLSGILWRLRNRLVVTYLFIGGAPLLLVVSLAIISAYFMSGQFAAYVATEDLHEHLQQISVENRTLAAHIANDLRSPRVSLADVPELKKASPRRVVELFDGNRHVVSAVGNGTFEDPPWLKDGFTGIVHDGQALYYRAANEFTAQNRPYTVVSSELLDSQAMGELLNGLGQIDLYGSGLVATSSGDFISTDQESGRAVNSDVKQAKTEQEKKAAVERARQRSEAERLHSGALPVAQNRLDGRLQYVAPLVITEWESGKIGSRALSVTTRPSILYTRLFSASAVWGTTLRDLLFGTAVFFGFLELFALFIGMRLTRSVTHAVHELYDATLHIERGDLRHRIRVRSTDQLAALEGSFNRMSESLGKLLQEQREKERLQSELAIAQQVQEQLFPRAWTTSRYVDLFGVCRPARSVSGDYYDFVSLSPTRTVIAVGDISGKGISAALLMATIQSAVRSYELGVEEQPYALPAAASSGSTIVAEMRAVAAHAPAQTMRLLNRHLYRSTPPEKYATLFFAIYDAETRTLSYTNAGHLPPFVIRQDGTVERLEVSGTVIGLFEDMQWEQAEVRLSPGDLVVAYSDGMTEPENEYGEFGEDRLIEVLRQNRTLSLEEIARRSLTAVQDWIGEGEQPDDMTVVLARAAT